MSPRLEGDFFALESECENVKSSILEFLGPRNQRVRPAPNVLVMDW